MANLANILLTRDLELFKHRVKGRVKGGSTKTLKINGQPIHYTHILDLMKVDLKLQDAIINALGPKYLLKNKVFVDPVEIQAEDAFKK